QKCYFFLNVYIFYISFNIGIYKTVPAASCLATSYPASPLNVWLKAYFHSQFKHTEYSAHLLRRSNAYLFRKSTCTRSTLTKLPVSKLWRQSSIFISPSMFILML